MIDVPTQFATLRRFSMHEHSCCSIVRRSPVSSALGCDWEWLPLFTGADRVVASAIDQKSGSRCTVPSSRASMRRNSSGANQVYAQNPSQPSVSAREAPS